MKPIAEDLNEIIYSVSELRIRIPGDKDLKSFAAKKEFDHCIFHIYKCLGRAQEILRKNMENNND